MRTKLNQVRQRKNKQEGGIKVFNKNSMQVDRLLNAIGLYFEKSETVKNGKNEKKKKIVFSVKFTLMVSVSVLIFLLKSC